MKIPVHTVRNYKDTVRQCYRVGSRCHIELFSQGEHTLIISRLIDPKELKGVSVGGVVFRAYRGLLYHQLVMRFSPEAFKGLLALFSCGFLSLNSPKYL